MAGEHENGLGMAFDDLPHQAVGRDRLCRTCDVHTQFLLARRMGERPILTRLMWPVDEPGQAARTHPLLQVLDQGAKQGSLLTGIATAKADGCLGLFPLVHV